MSASRGHKTGSGTKNAETGKTKQEWVMTTTEIENMSTVDQLRAMEDLWDALCENDEEIESPTWHDHILDERRKKIESGDAEFISIGELKETCNK